MNSSTVDKVVAVLAAIGGVFETVVSFAYWGVDALFITGITVVPLARVGEQGPYGPFYAVVLLAFGIGGLVFAVGAWGGHHWARDFGLILYSFNFLAGLLYMALYPNFLGLSFLSVSGTIMSLLFIIFLLTRTAQKAFAR